MLTIDEKMPVYIQSSLLLMHYALEHGRNSCGDIILHDGLITSEDLECDRKREV